MVKANDKLLLFAMPNGMPKYYVGGANKDPIKKASMGRFFRKERIFTNKVEKLGHKIRNQIGK